MYVYSFLGYSDVSLCFWFDGYHELETVMLTIGYDSFLVHGMVIVFCIKIISFVKNLT